MSFGLPQRTFEVGAATADRQLSQLLSGPDAARDIHLTTILRRLAAGSSDGASGSTSAAEWHKFLLRIQSLLQPSHDVRAGLRLAREVVSSAPWDAYAASISDWVQAALSHFGRATVEAIALLNDLLGQEGRQRPEYWRCVGADASQKYTLLLLEHATRAADDTSFSTTTALPHVLNALSAQVSLHPNAFRAHAPRIHKLCLKLLFERETCIVPATTLFARLPLTGQGRAGQAELWSASVNMLLREARRSWVTCSSTFVRRDDGEGAATSTVFPALDGDADDISTLRTAHRRLALLLGSAPRAGILGLFMAEPTAFAVPLPLDALMDMLLSIFAVLPTTPSQLETAPEAMLHAAQAALLPQAHLCALSMLVAVPNDVWHPQHARTIRRVLTLAQRGSNTIRCAALQTLVVLQLPIDPYSELLVQAARTCLAQLSLLVNQEETPNEQDSNGQAATAAATKMTNGGGGGGGRASKKRRVYEADQVLLRPLHGFIDLSEDERYACMAAAQYLGQLYGLLITVVSPQLHDLTHTSALLMLALVEIGLKDPGLLSARLVATLARMVSLSRAQILGLIVVRAASLCAEAMRSADEETRSAAETLQIALGDTLYPKLPPKLAVRLRVEHDKTSVEDADAKVLDEPMLDEERGLSERVAMRDVLGIKEDASNVVTGTAPSFAAGPPNPAPFHASAKDHASASGSPGLSPDPVKPTRRPSTPRIGSPGVPTAVATVVSTGSAAAADDDDDDDDDVQINGSSAPVAAAHTFASSAAASTTTTRPLRPKAPSSPLAKAVEATRVRDDDDNDNDNVMMTADDNDDSDGPMPELDMRSSDEESAAEEEEEEEEEG